MDKKLIDYLPPVLREVADFKAINAANEPEIILAWENLNQVLANQFLDSADEHGVSVWEQELQIRPKGTDTLEIRKERVKAQWNLELPYTIPWLKNWLTGMCGETGHEESVENYTLDVTLDYDALANAEESAANIYDTLRKIIPANLLLQVIAASTERAEMYAQVFFTGAEFCDGATAIQY